MKCPKCNYVSHDYLDACRKCGIDLVIFKQDIGLLVLQPGVLDLSLVLGGAGADDLCESVEQGVTIHASDDDDFDISLDDYTAPAGMRPAPAGAPRSGRPETEPEFAGMDHLTLELDASELPPEMTARLRAARVSTDAPPTTPAQAPVEPGATTLPGHVTLEIEPENISRDLATAEPSGSDMADVIEPTMTIRSKPPAEDMGLLPSFESESSTLSEAEATLLDGVEPTLDEAPLTFADEAMPRPPSVGAWTSTAAETPPEGLLTSSDMFALENLEDPIPPEHLTLELVPPALLDDAPSTPLSDAPAIPEPCTSAGTEPGEAVSCKDLGDIPLSSHLTLALDSSEMASEVSSIVPDNLQLENPPGDIQPKMPPHDDQADDEEELLLDLESFELDDDEPA